MVLEASPGEYKWPTSFEVEGAKVKVTRSNYLQDKKCRNSVLRRPINLIFGRWHKDSSLLRAPQLPLPFPPLPPKVGEPKIDFPLGLLAHSLDDIHQVALL